MRETLDFEVTGHRYRGFPSSDKRRLLLAAPTSLLLLDLDSGESRELPFVEGGWVFGAALLESGDVLVASGTGLQSSITMIPADGTEAAVIDLPGLRSGVEFGSQPAPGLLLFSARGGGFDGEESMHINLPMMFGSVASWRASVLDLNSKTVRQIGDGLRPVASPDVEPGSPGSRLL